MGAVLNRAAIQGLSPVAVRTPMNCEPPVVIHVQNEVLASGQKHEKWENLPIPHPSWRFPSASWQSSPCCDNSHERCGWTTGMTNSSPGRAVKLNTPTADHVQSPKTRRPRIGLVQKLPMAKGRIPIELRRAPYCQSLSQVLHKRTKSRTVRACCSTTVVGKTSSARRPEVQWRCADVQVVGRIRTELLTSSILRDRV